MTSAHRDLAARAAEGIRPTSPTSTPCRRGGAPSAPARPPPQISRRGYDQNKLRREERRAATGPRAPPASRPRRPAPTPLARAGRRAPPPRPKKQPPAAPVPGEEMRSRRRHRAGFARRREERKEVGAGFGGG
nr:acrosin-like [Aegilops tauschii subsp. strangulata]